MTRKQTTNMSCLIRNLFSELSTRSDTNQAAQHMSTQAGQLFEIFFLEEALYLSTYVANTKAHNSCVVSEQLFCVLIFAYAKDRFYHGMAQIPEFSQIRTKVAMASCISNLMGASVA